MTPDAGYTPRPDQQLVEVVACAGGPAGLVRIRGTVVIPGQLRFSDFCNRATGELELENASVEMLVGGKQMTRAAAERMLVNPGELDLIWTNERRRGGDPSMRVALDPRPVRVMTRAVDVLGVTRLPSEAASDVGLLVGRTKFITVSPARLASPYISGADAEGTLEVCLVNRTQAIAAAFEEAAAADLAPACQRARCENRASGDCAYTDATGATCGTTWCEQHSRKLGDRLYCERHHDVVVALGAAAGTIAEFRPPLVTDRTLSLIERLFTSMDEGVRTRLEPLCQGLAGATVSADLHVRHQILDGSICWERGWGVAVSQGYVARVLLRIPVGEPPVVKLLVNRHEVFSAVPDWIATRLAGRTPSERDQADFADHLLALAAEALKTYS